MSADVPIRVRRWLHGLLLFGFAGAGIELVLMSHYEDAWQLIPLALIAITLVMLFSLAMSSGQGILKMFRLVMILCIAAGLLGIVLHFRGAAEFQREIDPAQSRWMLTRKVMRVKAPPVLAPGLMAQLGLLGLIFSYRPRGTHGPEQED